MLQLAVSALAFHAGARPGVQSTRAPVAAMSDTNFYAVYHTFKKGKAEEWWAGIADIDMEAFAKTQHEAGIFNHNFMPGAVDGPILCLWESKDLEMGSADFKSSIDSKDSPAADLINKVYPINPAGMTPASAWPKMPAAPAATTGSFFWVHHTFNKGKAEAFWENMATIDMDAFAADNKKKGFCNHLFMPTTDPSTVFCVWESKAPMEVAAFQEFIDGPDGPAPGIFTNVAYPVMAGGSVPSAAFPKSWLDETMEKIEEILPLKLDEIKAKFEGAFAK